MFEPCSGLFLLLLFMLCLYGTCLCFSSGLVSSLCFVVCLLNVCTCFMFCLLLLGLYNFESYIPILFFLVSWFRCLLVTSIMTMIYPALLLPACVSDPAVYSDDGSWIALNKQYTGHLCLCSAHYSPPVIISALDKHIEGYYLLSLCLHGVTPRQQREPSPEYQLCYTLCFRKYFKLLALYPTQTGAGCEVLLVSSTRTYQRFLVTLYAYLIIDFVCMPSSQFTDLPFCFVCIEFIIRFL